jgi:hypothetical protein
MNTQDILKYRGYNLDISLDTSELYDFVLDTTEAIDLTLDMSEFYDFTLDLRYDEMDHVDLVLDYSEFYDFELVDGYVVESDILMEFKPLIKIKNEKYEWAILTQDEYVLFTQDDEYLQYLL